MWEPRVPSWRNGLSTRSGSPLGAPPVPSVIKANKGRKPKGVSRCNNGLYSPAAQGIRAPLKMPGLGASRTRVSLGLSDGGRHSRQSGTLAAVNRPHVESLKWTNGGGYERGHRWADPVSIQALYKP
ncbi:hypothetical protein NHX12_030947 [Muraenolepis orangiensis]|uniref:Uncharacterized protein n=1 Tax=Muraenolepis orangiensis TaxID=630683 RepID=A0A9Q0ILK0_9TELE|nr:hypothetical protein NHX12_030947 [Muraenolepis orangiensis]